MGGFHLGLVQITSSPLFGEITSRNFTQDPTGTGSGTSEEVCFCVSLGLEINLGEAGSNLEHPSPVHLLPVGLSAARWPLPGTCLRGSLPQALSGALVQVREMKW